MLASSSASCSDEGGGPPCSAVESRDAPDPSRRTTFPSLTCDTSALGRFILRVSTTGETDPSEHLSARGGWKDSRKAPHARQCRDSGCRHLCQTDWQPSTARPAPSIQATRPRPNQNAPPPDRHLHDDLSCREGLAAALRWRAARILAASSVAVKGLTT